MLACSRRLVSGEQRKNQRAKNEGRGVERKRESSPFFRSAFVTQSRISRCSPLTERLEQAINIYYSTNSRDAHIWSESHCIPSSVHNRYPAIYVGCQDSSEILQSAARPQFFSLQKRFVYNVLNNKTIIPLNLAEYRLI